MDGRMPNFEEMQAEEQQRQEMEERRLSILDQILEPLAKSRLKTLSMVKKEKARYVEDALIKAATNGQLQAKVTEAQLIAMLEQIGGGAEEEGVVEKKKVTIQRRKTGFDDDSDDNDDDLM
jgi:programmed cell death protein 5